MTVNEQRREIQRQCEGWFLTALIHVLHDFPCDQLRIIERVTGRYLAIRENEAMERLARRLCNPMEPKEPQP